MTMENPPHPGRVLKADFEKLGLSVAQGAAALGVSRSQAHRFISGESAVSAELALRLETVIGGTVDHWLQMQAAYDAAEVRTRAGEIVKGLKRVEPPETPPPEQPGLL